MKIIIVGAGQVGSSLAINLVKEGNDVTLIDKSADLLENIADKVDLQTMHGNGAHPRILEAAGAHKADMIVAVSKSDETNTSWNDFFVKYSIDFWKIKIFDISNQELMEDSLDEFLNDDY